VIVVDDVLLLTAFSERRTTSVDRRVADAIAAGELFTTGAWYWRLARAVSASSMGRLSRAAGELSKQEQQLVSSALSQFPDEIGMLHLRTLVPVMATLSGPPNLLTAEAVAAAIVLDASILVTTDSELLRRTASAVGVTVEVV
jgi:hypothetical protein